MSKLLCFKPLRNMHESGFRYIEYGYIDNANMPDETVEVVGRYDVISTLYEPSVPFNLDLTKSGWFRVLPRKDVKLKWQYGGAMAIEEQN